MESMLSPLQLQGVAASRGFFLASLCVYFFAFMISWLIIMAFFVSGVVSH